MAQGVRRTRPTLRQPTPPPQIIALNLPAPEIEGLKAVFTAMDKDGSGTITAEEMKEGLKAKVWGGGCGGGGGAQGGGLFLQPAARCHALPSPRAPSSLTFRPLPPSPQDV